MHPIIKNSLIAFGTITIASGAVIGLLKISNAFLPLTAYIGTLRTASSEIHPDCPKLQKVPGPNSSYLIKDDCTNTYWMAHDLPILNSSGVMEGYTWQEAADACAGVATVGTGTNKRSLFRLPTTEELYALVGTNSDGTAACVETGLEQSRGCAEIVRVGGQMKNESNTNIPTEADIKYTMYAGSTISGTPETRIFADGAYWSGNTLQADEYRPATGDKPAAVAGGSVNLRYGTVNNPVYSKNIKLNVRCIANNIGAGDVQYSSKVERVTEDLDVNSVRWWQSQDAVAGAKKYSIAYVKNWSPTTLDENDCPEGLNTDLLAPSALCMGVTEFTNQPQYFTCGTSYLKNGSFFTATGETKNTLSPIICNN